VRVLAFDTATEYLSVCLYDSDRGVLALQRRDGPLRHGANLAPLISEVLRPSDPKEQPLSQIDLVACAEGPGSFTGLRIGYATAKGLAAAAGNLPTVAIGTIEALARRRRDFDGLVLPLLDARKGRFYTALFEKGARLTEDMDLTPEEILQLLLGRNALTTGFHSPLFRERIPPEALEALSPDPDATEPLAPTLGEMAIEAFAKGGSMEPGAGPRYVRRSDAEIGRAEG
jgi:tRNA threonylcarbamoyladenosine biosynthesis protein TsaB